MHRRRPQHIGFIPDGNRRWAEARGRRRAEGYGDGIGPGIRLLEACMEARIEEVSIYGYTKENVHRPADQVQAFKSACVEYAMRALDCGAALKVVGDAASSAFPAELQPYAQQRSPGRTRVNLMANYGWQWDLCSLPRDGVRRGEPPLASRDVSRIDLVVRWGGRRRLSGFLPFQSAYADLYVIDTLWPDMRLEEFEQSLCWYAEQDVTLGG